MVFVSLSAGAMMGAAFLHFLPETPNYLLTLISFCLFFLIEKLLHWRHCHKTRCHIHTFGYMNLIGDGLHNFLDGLIIAAAFSVNQALGWSTVLALALHEIPQEIADFGVLLYAGWSKQKALFANFSVALTAVLGGLLGYYFSLSTTLSEWLIPVAAGGFIYIAASDLLPEIRKEKSLTKTLLNFGTFVLGILIISIFKD